MTDKTADIDRSRSKLHEMVVRGSNYREEYEFELHGEEVTAILRPLVDDEFLPVAAFLAEHFDLEDEVEKEEAVDEAIDRVEDEELEEDGVDITQMDDDFVAVMQRVAMLGLDGALDEDGNEVKIESRDEAKALVNQMLGGYSVELGGRVLKISGSVRDAEKFRGGRGRVDSSRNS